MNRGELRTLVWDWVDDPLGTYFTAPIVNVRLNLALKELQKQLISANHQYYTRCVYTMTVQGQPNYALPQDFYQVISMNRVTSGTGTTANTTPIWPITPNQRYLIPENSGKPSHYWFEKDQIIFKPVPQSPVQINLEYSYVVTDMANDNSIPDAPEVYQEYIAVLCARDCFLKDGRPLTPIESKMAEYKETLKQISEQRNAQTTRMVVSTSDGFGGYY